MFYFWFIDNTIESNMRYSSYHQVIFDKCRDKVGTKEYSVLTRWVGNNRM